MCLELNQHICISVDGKWSSWGAYGSCSETCGPGTKSRSRSCNNPAPAHGGAACAGSGTESVNCVITSCSTGKH